MDTLQRENLLLPFFSLYKDCLSKPYILTLVYYLFIILYNLYLFIIYLLLFIILQALDVIGHLALTQWPSRKQPELYYGFVTYLIDETTALMRSQMGLIYLFILYYIILYFFICLFYLFNNPLIYIINILFYSFTVHIPLLILSLLFYLLLLYFLSLLYLSIYLSLLYIFLFICLSI